MGSNLSYLLSTVMVTGRSTSVSQI